MTTRAKSSAPPTAAKEGLALDETLPHAPAAEAPAVATPAAGLTCEEPGLARTHDSGDGQGGGLPAPAPLPVGAGPGALPTTHLARYNLVREFARGGLGRIIEADDTCLGRKVAIKELHSGTEARARFLREALITARLQHPSIPVPLEDVRKLKIPAELSDVLRRRNEQLESIYLDPQRENFPERLAASVLECAGADQEEEIVLHLGHRRSEWTVELPEPFRELPAIDLRLDLRGHRDYSPSDEEWAEIERGLDALRVALSRARRINVCGHAPTGLGVAVGRCWDRGTNFEVCAWNTTTRQVWSSAIDVERSASWTPENGRAVRAPRPLPGMTSSGPVVLALLPKEEHLGDVMRWTAARDQLPVLWLQPPEVIADGEQAKAVLSECEGALRWARRALPQATRLELISGLPMALMTLLAHRLRALGPMSFWDEVKGEERPHLRYRRAASWS